MDDQEGLAIRQSDGVNVHGDTVDTTPPPANMQLTRTLTNSDVRHRITAEAVNNFNPPHFHHHTFEDPKNQVRLLEILSGSFEDKIESTLRAYDWSTKPDYTAISYVWGDTTNRASILIDNAICLVGQNCLYALKQARSYLAGPCLVWIDAICINQLDNQEKSAQVSIMGDIFKAARLVLACVGEEDVDSRFLVETTLRLENLLYDENIAADASSCSQCYRVLGKWAEEDFHVAHIMIAEESSEHWETLVDLFEEFCNRPYGKRLWVVQELVLASNIYFLCGQTSISFRTLHLLYNILNNVAKGADVLDGGSYIHSYAAWKGLKYDADAFEQNPMNTVFDSWGSSLDVYTAFLRLGDLECADPRDRIYGTLKLIDWPDGPPTPDYNGNKVELAVDILNRIGRKLVFKQHVEAILAFLAGADAHGRADARSLLRKLTYEANPSPNIDTGSTACHCQSPVIPRVAMLEKRWTSASVRAGQEGDLYADLVSRGRPDQHIPMKSLAKRPPKDMSYSYMLYRSNTPPKAGDMLVEIDHSLVTEADSMCNPSFWLLRRMICGYYEIIGLATVRVPCYICPGGWQCPEQVGGLRCPLPERRNRAFCVSLDAIDAVTYCIFNCGERLDESRGERVVRLLSNVPDRAAYAYFSHLRCSSFAFEFAGGVPVPGPSRTCPVPEILGVASVDGKTIPCAYCGALFVPDEVLFAPD